MDFGCAQRIIDGCVKVKSGIEIERFEPNGLAFSDDTHTEADIVVLA
jgi:hypothetical protein